MKEREIILIKGSVDYMVKNLANSLNETNSEEDRAKIIDLISEHIELRKQLKAKQ